MKVRELMTTDLEMAQPDSTLEELAAMMKESNVGSIPVVDEDGELAGIVTDRDIVVRCIAEGKDPAEATAEDVMSEELETVEPESNVDEAAEVMARNQIRRLPVVENGRLVGMLALGDIAVKTGHDRVSGETLEKVSEGVKGGGRRSAANQESEGGRGRSSARTGSSRSEDTGGRRGAMQTQSVRNAGQTGSMRASKSRGAARQQQGVTNHSAQEEDRRQERVVSIRPEAKGAKRTGKRRAG